MRCCSCGVGGGNFVQIPSFEEVGIGQEERLGGVVEALEYSRSHFGDHIMLLSFLITTEKEPFLFWNRVFL